MSLLTANEKKDKNLMTAYNKYLQEGLKPQKALRKAKELYGDKPPQK